MKQVSRVLPQPRPEITLPSTTIGPEVFCAGAGAGLPALLARARVQADHVAVGRGVEHDILIDGEALGARRAGRGAGNLALVFPEQIAVGGVERLHDRARRNHVHHAVVHDREWFRVVPGPRPRVQAMRSWLTLSRLICLSGLKRCAS